MLSILRFLIIFMIASSLPACSNLTSPSKDAAKKYFIEQCIRGIEVESLSDFNKNTKIDFKAVSSIKKGTNYDFYYRAEIEYLIDGDSFRKGEKQYYEGTVSFIKKDDSWAPQNITVYGHKCIQ